MGPPPPPIILNSPAGLQVSYPVLLALGTPVPRLPYSGSLPLMGAWGFATGIDYQMALALRGTQLVFWSNSCRLSGAKVTWCSKVPSTSEDQTKASMCLWR